MYCWHILANKHHDMPDTNYDKFNLVVSTLFLNKWYLKKSTFFENDPHKKSYKSHAKSQSQFFVDSSLKHLPVKMSILVH